MLEKLIHHGFPCMKTLELRGKLRGAFSRRVGGDHVGRYDQNKSTFIMKLFKTFKMHKSKEEEKVNEELELLSHRHKIKY